MDIKVVTEMWCEYCVRAKSLLKEHNIEFEEVSISDAMDLMDKYELNSIPQIFINGVLLEGGYTGLKDNIYNLKKEKL
jgi:glutaredoxin